MKTGKIQTMPVIRNHRHFISAKSIVVNFIIIAGLSPMFRCAPFVCDMQSARLAGKHKVEITPGVTSIQFAQVPANTEKPKETVGQLYGIQAAYGMTDKMDLRVRIEHLEYRNQSMTLYSVGPKFMIWKDHIALYVPVWFIGLTPAQTQPTFLFTIPLIKNKVEFNPSVKGLISLGGYDPSTRFLTAWKIGVGISTDLSKWAIRPEYGVVNDLGEKCQYSNFSIGLSLNLSNIFKN